MGAGATLAVLGRADRGRGSGWRPVSLAERGALGPGDGNGNGDSGFGPGPGLRRFDCYGYKELVIFCSQSTVRRTSLRYQLRPSDVLVVRRGNRSHTAGREKPSQK